MRFSLAALSTVLLMGVVYASPAPGNGDGDGGHDNHHEHEDHGKHIDIDHLNEITNKYYCIDENHLIDLKLLTGGGDGCAQSALLDLGLL